MDKTFQLTSEYIELVKLLKATCVCATGGEAKIVITDGIVMVDGELETRRKRKIRAGQIVSFQGNTIKVL